MQNKLKNMGGAKLEVPKIKLILQKNSDETAMTFDDVCCSNPYNLEKGTVGFEINKILGIKLSPPHLTEAVEQGFMPEAEANMIKERFEAAQQKLKIRLEELKAMLPTNNSNMSRS